MKRTLFGAVGTLAVVALFASCVSDPTASLRTGVVDRVAISRTYMELDVGGELTLTAQAYDAQGNALPDLPTISSSDAAVVSVEVDEDVSGDPQPLTTFKITTLAPGSATLTATAGGVNSDPSTVISFPLTFAGAVSVDATNPWDVVSISATSNVTFDPASTTVTVGGAPVFIESITSDAISVVALAEAAVSGAEVEVFNVQFLGSVTIASLVAETTVDVRGTGGEGGTSPDPAPDITAGGFPQVLYTLVTPGSPDKFMELTAGGTPLDVTAVFDWVSTDPTHAPDDEDIDILWTDDPFTAFVGNFSGATGARPEQSSVQIPAGTTWNLWTNLYAGNGAIVQITLTSP
jgi:hypothetical protein